MANTPRIAEISWTRGPLEVAAAWPSDLPLLMLHSADVHERWGRWSILTSPSGWFSFNGRSRWIGARPAELAGVQFTHEPLRDLDAILAATRVTANDAHGLPFVGGWIGCLSYDLGRWIEPAVGGGAACRGTLTPALSLGERGTAGTLTPALSLGERGGNVGLTKDDPWPLIELGWCPWALVHDAIEQRWFAVGVAPKELLDADLSRSRSAGSDDWHAGPLQARRSPDAYLAAVERTIQYIRAGDVFQANIAQQFGASFSGSARAIAIHAQQTSGARYGSLLEFGEGAAGSPGRSLVSLSPELFLHVDAATRIVTTRPIKGTRPAGTDPAELLASAKDAAELHMIVDLMRNDLGRVCEFGSVQVPNPRSIESYPTVHHGVAEVIGRLRPGVTVGGLLQAAFPGGSVTGAPKIRAMQIIDELEPARRGPYCGSIGYFSDDGNACLNIAIRTAMLQGRRDAHRFDQIEGDLRYWAGCGIVADSDPRAEYQESLDKAAVLRLALEQHSATTR